MATVQQVLPGVDEVLPVHPVAELFPMMSDEELNDLAADIKANGLVHPIVIDGTGVLIDGRNRLEACRRADVEPEWTTFDGDDPVAFILSLNVARRHLNKGQAATAVVRAQSLRNKDWARGDQVALATQLGVSEARLSQARTVMEHAPELVGRVLSDDLALNDAYAAAVQSKRTRKSAEDEARQHQADMARLREGASDLADQVEDHRLELKIALTKLEERRESQRQLEVATLNLLYHGMTAFNAKDDSDRTERAKRLYAGLGTRQLGDGSLVTVERLRSCAGVIDALIELMEQEGKP